MQLIVQTLCGKSYRVDVEETSTIFDVKCKIQDKEGIPPDQARLIFKGMQLQNGKKVKEYQLTDGDTIHIVLRLRCICECTEAPKEIRTFSRMKQQPQLDTFIFFFLDFSAVCWCHM